MTEERIYADEEREILQSMSEAEVEALPYTMLFKDEDNIVLWVGAYSGEMSWDEVLRHLADTYEFMRHVNQYVRYHFPTATRAWEWALRLQEKYDPVFQGVGGDPNQVPPPELLDAMLNYNPPGKDE